jgi:hypothetical protein
MFFYLFYNSTLIKSNSEGQKNINTLIYGSIIYIILHAVLFSKSEATIRNLRTYYWLLFTLDCTSIAFTYIMNNNGKLFYDNKIHFESPNKNTLKEDIKDLSIEVNKLRKKPEKPILKSPNSKIETKEKTVKFNLNTINEEHKLENPEIDIDTKSLGSDASDYDLDEFESSLRASA